MENFLSSQKNRKDDVLVDDQVYQTTVVKKFSNMQTRRQILFSDSSIDSKTETHPMKKYNLFSRNLRSQRQALQADSDVDDVDNGNGRSIGSHERYEQWRVVSWAKTIVSVILTILTTIFNIVTLKSLRTKERPYTYNYRHYQSEFGILLNLRYSKMIIHCCFFLVAESRFSRFVKRSDSYLQYFYFLMVKTLLLDTWLLSRLSTLRQHIRKRQGLVWLVVLPPLLFGGE